MVASDHEKPRAPWKKWAAIGVAVAAGAAAVAAFSFARTKDVTPTVKIPVSAPPSPNAYDEFAAAANAILDEHNRRTVIPTLARPTEFNPLNPGFTAADKENVLANNREALARVRRGLAYAYGNPALLAHGTHPSFDSKFPTLARLLVLEGQVKAAHGDLQGQMNCLLDAIEMGELTPRGGLSDGRGYGNVCEMIGRRDMWDAAGRLKAKEAQATLARLLTIMDKHVPFAETVREEKWTTQTRLLEAYRKKNWVRQAQGISKFRSASMANELPSVMPLSKGQVMASYSAYMDSVIGVFEHGYNAELKEPEAPTDAVNRSLVFTWMYDPLWFRTVVQENEDQLLATTLALRAYELDHGALPPTLDALAPAYLPKVPVDLFSAGGAPKYRVSGGKYLLYSVGPDGKDDGGNPIVNPGARRGHWRYLPQPLSHGDMVVRINCG
jgi:hypothetical protein